MQYSKSDVPYSLAERAFVGTSYSPERRAESVQNGYCNEMSAAVEFAEKYRTEENSGAIDEALEKYQVQYLAKLRGYLGAHSRVVSQFVTGAGGWTGRMVRAQEKRNNTVDNRLNELLETKKRFYENLRKQFDPLVIAKAPIRAEDADAEERLETKIAKLEEKQALMKATNAIVRKKISDDEKVAAIQALGLSESIARQLLVPDFAGRVGFPSYELTNNNANIRRLRGRVEEVSALRAKSGGEFTDEESGIRAVDSTEDNRVQLFFPGKPSEDVRDTLKASGFRWAPSVGAWQAYRNWHSFETVRKFVPDFQEA